MSASSWGRWPRSTSPAYPNRRFPESVEFKSRRTKERELEALYAQIGGMFRLALPELRELRGLGFDAVEATGSRNAIPKHPQDPDSARTAMAASPEAETRRLAATAQPWPASPSQLKPSYAIGRRMYVAYRATPRATPVSFSLPSLGTGPYVSAVRSGGKTEVVYACWRQGDPMRVILFTPISMGQVDFWLTTVPEFVGQLVAVALLVLPWLLFRRRKWGRLVVIALHTAIALLVLAARSNPYYPPEAQPSWTLLLGLPAVLILAGYDRRKREAKESP